MLPLLPASGIRSGIRLLPRYVQEHFLFLFLAISFNSFFWQNLTAAQVANCDVDSQLRVGLQIWTIAAAAIGNAGDVPPSTQQVSYFLGVLCFCFDCWFCTGH